MTEVPQPQTSGSDNRQPVTLIAESENPALQGGGVDQQLDDVLSPERVEGSLALKVDELMPLVDVEEFHNKTGLFGNLVATVQLGNSRLGIIDRQSFLREHDLPSTVRVLWMSEVDSVNGSRMYETSENIHAFIFDPKGDIVRNEQGTPKLFPLRSGESVSVGRAEDNTISLDGDNFVSSRHADITYDQETGQISIADRDSTNGTFIEKKQRSSDDTVDVPIESEVSTQDTRDTGGDEWWNGAVDAAKSSIDDAAPTTASQPPSESTNKPPELPEPPKSVEQTDYEGELPPPYNPDAKGEQVPTDPSVYFESPQSLRSALNDKEMDPKMRAELRGVVVAWQELQHSEVARSLWEETIRPRLNNLAELNLAQQAQEIQILTQEVNQQADGWRMLTNYLYEGAGIEDAMRVVRKYQLGPEAAQHVELAYKQLVHNDTTQRVVKALGLDTEEADAKVRRLGYKIDGVNIEDDDAEALIAKVREMGIEQRAVTDITQELRDSVTFESWRSIVYNVEELSILIKRGTGRLNDPALEHGFRMLREYITNFDDMRRRQHRFDPELTQLLGRTTNQIVQDLDRARRFTNMSMDEANWLKNR